MITKEIFKQFISGSYDQAEASSAALAIRRRRAVSISDGYLTYPGAEELCYNLSLPGPLLATLVKVHRVGARDSDAVTLDKLRRCLLLDSQNCLTRHGYYKMVACLSLKDQANELALPYSEEIFNNGSAPLKTEEHVCTAYIERGYRCIHDEGGLLSALIDAVLRPNSAMLKPLISPDSWYTPDSPVYEAMVPYVGNYETIDPIGPKYVSSNRKAALLSLVLEASEERIIAGHQLHSKAFEQLPAAAGHGYSLEPLLDLFACIGVKRLHELARFTLEHPDCGHGRPDLIAFRENELMLIEVKRTDKLMFHQARTIHMLSALPKDVVSHVGIVKLVVE